MRPVSFSRLTDDVLALYGPSMRARATFRAMRQTLAELAAVRGVRKSSDLTVSTIARWIELHPGRSPARTESLLRNVRVVCNIAVASGWLAVSPFSVRKLGAWVRLDGKPRRPVHRHKTAEEVVRLLRLLDAEASGGAWAAGRLQALVYVYVYAALRRDEALHLLAANVDLGRRTITVEPVGTWRPKTVRSARTLPMAEPLAEVLALWLPRCGSPWLFPGRRLKSPWSGGPGYKPIDLVRAAARRAGIGDVTIIGLRKTFGTLAKAMGLGPLEVKAILGHTTIATQAHYDEEAVESLRGAMEKVRLFFDRPRASTGT
jgi:integrase